MSKFWKIILILLIIWIIGFAIASLIKFSIPKNLLSSGNIALIPIEGTISIENTRTLLRETSSTQSILKNIKDAEDNPNIKAIILEINSPGGAVVASRELANAVKESEKPVIAWIRETGASGAYWIASGADKIIADPLSITGSIGVTASYLEFSGLLDKYSVEYEQVTAGDLKELGSPFKDLEPQERLILQKKLDKIQEVFINDVKENRNLNEEQVKKISSGEFYIGEEAYKLNLVDILGSEKEVLEEAKVLINATEVNLVEFREKKSFLDLFTKASAYYFGQGFASALIKERIKNNLKIEAV